MELHDAPGGEDFPHPYINQGEAAGPYSHLQDPSGVGPGKDFTANQIETIYAENMRRNNGVLRSDSSGTELVRSVRDVAGQSNPPNAAQVDLITPKDKGGSNSYSNAQVLSFKENRRKSNS